MMIPVPVLFSTPEDGANELRFLVHRGYPFDRVELGEEPDGQYITPEDYASFYLRWSRALRGIAPHAALGGPSFQSPESQMMMAWPEDSAGAPWMTRFLSVLRKRNRLGDFGFLSFEWYPFDDVCAATAPQLASAPGRLSDALRRLHDAGRPALASARSLPNTATRRLQSERRWISRERSTMRISWDTSCRSGVAPHFSTATSPRISITSHDATRVGKQRALSRNESTRDSESGGRIFTPSISSRTTGSSSATRHIRYMLHPRTLPASPIPCSPPSP